MQNILVESIRTDGAVQSRAAINAEYVAELAEQIKAGVKLPPVDVYRNGDETWIADGFHRLRAHEAAGVRNIRAEIHKGTKADAAWHSTGANLKHGLRRTNADKRRAVEMALKLKPNTTDRLIADHCGVDDHTVASARRLTCGNSAPAMRTGRDGKQYPPPPQPLPKIGGVPKCPPPPPQGVPANRTITPPPPPPPAVDKDALGNPIPDHLAGLFKRCVEVSDVLRQISEARGAVRAGADDPLWAECDRQAAEAGLSTAYDAIKATTPYAVCPWCHGGPMQRDCLGCGGRGVVGKFRYDTAVPEELKK